MSSGGRGGSHLTPREVIRDFIELLDIVYQNPGAGVRRTPRSDGFEHAKPEPPEGLPAGPGAVRTQAERPVQRTFAEFEL